MDNVFEPASIVDSLLSLCNRSFTFLSGGGNMRGEYSECEIDRQSLIFCKPGDSRKQNKF